MWRADQKADTPKGSKHDDDKSEGERGVGRVLGRWRAAGAASADIYGLQETSGDDGSESSSSPSVWTG